MAFGHMAFFVTLALCLALAAGQTCRPCVWQGDAPGSFNFFPGPPLEDPLIVESQNGELNITLEVDICRFEGFVSYTARGYKYNGECMIPAPTWKVAPGDRIVVRLINNLGPGDDEFDQPGNHDLDNVPRFVNRTNLHTHGMKNDPRDDSVYRVALPGETIEYYYDILDDHAPGVHWYHAHLHGSTTLQVHGGMSGAILVDPAEGVEMPPELANLERHTLHMHHFMTDTPIPEIGAPRPRPYAELAELMRDRVDPEIEQEDESVGDVYFTNGQYQPFLDMMRNQRVVFDLINAVGENVLELEVRDGIGPNGTQACQMDLLGLDGVYFEAPRPVDFIAVAQGARATFTVLCEEPGTYFLQTYDNNETRPDIEFVIQALRFRQNLLTLNVGEEGDDEPDPLPTDMTALRQASYLRDLRPVEPDYIWSLSVNTSSAPAIGEQFGYHPNDNKKWMGIGRDCRIGHADNQGIARTCTYRLFPEDPLWQGETLPLRSNGVVGTVEQMEIHGGSQFTHPVHQHVYHVQVVEPTTELFLKYWGQIGDWVDSVVPVHEERGGDDRVGITVRYPVTHDGEVILHCHFLFHEDTGMMDIYYVSPADDPGHIPLTGSQGFFGEGAAAFGIPSAEQLFDEGINVAPGGIVDGNILLAPGAVVGQDLAESDNAAGR